MKRVINAALQINEVGVFIMLVQAKEEVVFGLAQLVRCEIGSTGDRVRGRYTRVLFGLSNWPRYTLKKSERPEQMDSFDFVKFEEHGFLFIVPLSPYPLD